MRPKTPDARKGECFLHKRGQYLGDHGFQSDPGCVQYDGKQMLFYHYTREEHLDAIFGPEGGLLARVALVPTELTPEFVGMFCVNLLFEALPKWLTECPCFGSFGQELFQAVTGDILLEVRLPPDWPGLYVVDNAHWIECYHVNRRGEARLHLGYETRTGRESAPATTHSMVPLREYRLGHVCPNVQAIRRGEGIVIPPQLLRVSAHQPRQG